MVSQLNLHRFKSTKAGGKPFLLTLQASPHLAGGVVVEVVAGCDCPPVLGHCHLGDIAGHPQHLDLSEHQVVGVHVILVCDCDLQNVLKGRGEGKNQSLG